VTVTTALFRGELRANNENQALLTYEDHRRGLGEALGAKVNKPRNWLSHLDEEGFTRLLETGTLPV